MLEFIYRVVFGDKRLDLWVGVAAFGSQVLVWALFFIWLSQRMAQP